MSDLVGFLTNLAANPRQQLTFAAGPAAMMAQSQLNPADRALLLGGDVTQLAAAYSHLLPQPAYGCFDPVPDPLPDPDPSND